MAFVFLFVAMVRGDCGGEVCSEKELTSKQRKSTETITSIQIN